MAPDDSSLNSALTPDEEIKRAARAKQIINDDLFKEAVTKIETAILQAIANSPLKDSDLREKLCQQYIALQTFIRQFQQTMETGMLAEEQIRRETWMERAKKAVGF